MESIKLTPNEAQLVASHLDRNNVAYTKQRQEDRERNRVYFTFKVLNSSTIPNKIKHYFHA